MLNFERFVNEAMSQQDLVRVNDEADKLFNIGQLRALMSIGLVAPYHMHQLRIKMVKVLSKKFSGFKLAEVLASGQAPNVSASFGELSEVLRSPELRELLDIGLVNVSTNLQLINGNIVLSFNPNYSNGNDWALGFFPSVLDIRRIINKKVAPASKDQMIKRFKGSMSDKEFFLTAFRWAKDNLENDDTTFSTKRTNSIKQTTYRESSELVELIDRLIKTKLGQSVNRLDVDLLRRELHSTFYIDSANERRANIKALTGYFKGESVEINPNPFIAYNADMLTVLSDPRLSVDFKSQQIMLFGEILDLSDLNLKVLDYLHSLGIMYIPTGRPETFDVVMKKLHDSGLRSIKYTTFTYDNMARVNDAEVDAMLTKHRITRA
jgi:hypothetical protein